MPWWAWIVIGCFLLVAELVGVDAAFYLVFIGIAAILTGSIELAGHELPLWEQWLVFGFIAVVSMFLFRERVYKRLRGSVGFSNTLIGEIVNVEEDIASGQRARIQLRGSRWTAINVGDETIRAGQASRVVESDGTILKIRAVDKDSGTGGS